MNESKIVKVRLHETKKGRGLVISSIDTDPNGEEVNNPGAIHKALIHKNLQAGLDALAIHFAIMAGYVKPGAVEDIAMPAPELTESFRIKGYSLGGDVDEGTAGVIISGHKVLANGMAHNFNTPFYKFEQAPQSRYTFMDDLIAKLRYLDERIVAYKNGDEKGEPVQQEMDFKDDGKVTKMKVATPLDEKISPEAKLASKSDQHKYAGKAQMEGVAEMESKSKAKSKKRVAQSADAPGGIVDHE